MLSLEWRMPTVSRLQAEILANSISHAALIDLPDSAS
jgi:hypothetical protein